MEPNFDDYPSISNPVLHKIKIPVANISQFIQDQDDVICIPFYGGYTFSEDFAVIMEYVTYVILIITMALGSIGNALTLFVSPTFIQQSRLNAFVAFLAFNDLVTSSSSCPLQLSSLSSMETPRCICVIEYFIRKTSFLCTMCYICVICATRLWEMQRTKISAVGVVCIGAATCWAAMVTSGYYLTTPDSPVLSCDRSLTAHPVKVRRDQMTDLKSYIPAFGIIIVAIFFNSICNILEVILSVPELLKEAPKEDTTAAQIMPPATTFSILTSYLFCYIIGFIMAFLTTGCSRMEIVSHFGSAVRAMCSCIPFIVLMCCSEEYRSSLKKLLTRWFKRNPAEIDAKTEKKKAKDDDEFLRKVVEGIKKA